MWVLFLQPTLFLNEIFSSVDFYSTYLEDSIYYLYYLLVLFVNSTLLEFAIESYIIYSHHEIFLHFSTGSFIRRGAKVVTYTVGGAATAGAGIAYSPAVDILGVNYFQIHYGRGYGYETSLDWAKGVVMQSYLKKEVMAELVEKHGNKDKIVDGDFYCEVMARNNLVVQTLKKKCTPMEKRLLGL